jgi:hypothetical protein
MELRHLRCFLAVAEELHFTRAAELHIEQLPLSRVIKELEEYLGAPLFIRTTRSTRLTRAGKLFLEHMPRVFTALQQAHDSVNAAANGFLGRAGRRLAHRRQSRARLDRPPVGGPFAAARDPICCAWRGSRRRPWSASSSACAISIHPKAANPHRHLNPIPRKKSSHEKGFAGPACSHPGGLRQIRLAGQDRTADSRDAGRRSRVAEGTAPAMQAGPRESG